MCRRAAEELQELSQVYKQHMSKLRIKVLQLATVLLPLSQCSRAFHERSGDLNFENETWLCTVRKSFSYRVWREARIFEKILGTFFLLVKC